MPSQEDRIKSITRIYYSNPKIQEVIFEFAKNREVVPRYFESFGKRPDTLQYPSDIMNLVNKGATSFHASEEIWLDPFQINSDMSSSELSKIRKSWDLLIDIDSSFLDYSKIAARLILEELEKQEVKNYGIKFSGSRGFHIVIPGKAFPKTFQDQETKNMFPEWPRIILEYILYRIRPSYNKEITKVKLNFKALEERTKLSREDITETLCPNCNTPSKKGKIITYKCQDCNTTIERKDYNNRTKTKLRCIQDSCPGYLIIAGQKDYYYCENCKTSSIDIRQQTDKKIIYTKEAKQKAYSPDFEEQIAGSKIASMDLVLVSSRHLFRMPYSLHEKTALVSIVIGKEQLKDFNPKDANPLKLKIINFYPDVKEGEATRLLDSALSWKKINEHDKEKKEQIIKNYVKYEDVDSSKITEDIFPKPIKKLLKGLKDGRKRGLFVLLTFFRSINFSHEYINNRIIEWNKLNDPPLKEGYVKSQISWHLKQKRKILPPNYSNDNFYKDLNLIGEYPKSKNPVSEVLRELRKFSK